ncbi:hypothetical protein SMICM304S_02146 [Streptomyces microflavus]
MEPHAATAWWVDGHLTVHDSSQGSDAVRKSLARVLGLGPEHITVVPAAPRSRRSCRSSQPRTPGRRGTCPIRHA